MNIFKNIFGKNNKVTDNNRIDFDKKTGLPLFKDDIISEITTKLDDRKNQRLSLENQWILNSNFLSGNQYCEINTYSNQIEQTEAVYDSFERETFNRISPLIQTRIANLKKLKYLMTVRPRTNEIDDYAKSNISTELLRYNQNVSGFNSVMNTALWWVEICGSAFILNWWDSSKGDEYARIQEQSIAADGTETFTERAYYEGDIDYGVLSAFEVYPESIFKQNIKEQRSIIIEQVKSVDEIYDLYGVEAEGSDVDTFSLTPVEMTNGYGSVTTVNTLSHVKAKNSAKVITYFERPNRRSPNGRLIIIVDEKELVYYGDLPYNTIPLVQINSIDVPGQFFGKSVIQELIPLQRAYNGCVNRIHQFIKQIALNGFLAEEGSIDIDDFETNSREPGALVFYKKGSNKPTPIPNGNLPGEVINEKHELENNMEYVAGVSQLMAIGSTPSGVTSGTAIESLKEIDNTRLALTGDNIRNAVIDIAKIWLRIYKEMATTRRIIRTVGLNEIGNMLVWSNDDINSYDVVFDTDNELVVSEEMQRQRFIESYKMGLFTNSDGVISQRIKNKALNAMKIGAYSDMMSMHQLQVQAAQRENVFFENGIIPEISEHDDNAIHIEEHTRYILQMKFQLLKIKKPEYANELLKHLKQHNDLNEFEQRQNFMSQVQDQQNQKMAP